MKKIILTLVLSSIITMTYSQDNKTAQRFKYVTEAPDGSIAMTIYDNSWEDNMTLESAENFYRFEIVEPVTSETVYSGHNNGKSCSISKTIIEVGTYDLRLYTASFIITSKITISATRKIYEKLHPSKEIVASRDY